MRKGKYVFYDRCHKKRMNVLSAEEERMDAKYWSSVFSSLTQQHACFLKLKTPFMIANGFLSITTSIITIGGYLTYISSEDTNYIVMAFGISGFFCTLISYFLDRAIASIDDDVKSQLKEINGIQNALHNHDSKMKFQEKLMAELSHVFFEEEKNPIHEELQNKLQNNQLSDQLLRSTLEQGNYFYIDYVFEYEDGSNEKQTSIISRKGIGSASVDVPVHFQKEKDCQQPSIQTRGNHIVLSIPEEPSIEIVTVGNHFHDQISKGQVIVPHGFSMTHRPEFEVVSK